MANFVQSTILTQHALDRLDECLYAGTLLYDENDNLIMDSTYNTLPFNLTKIVISNSYSPLVESTEHLANEIYILPIEKVQMNGNIFTIYGNIPGEIAGLKLQQVGVYETVDNESKLFAFGNIDSYKPNTEYSLVINMEINVENVQMYKDKLDIKIVFPEVVPASTANKIVWTFADIYDYLHHAIVRNREILDEQPVQVGFDKEKYRDDITRVTSDMLLYAQSLTIAKPSNMFYMDGQDLLTYRVNNLLVDDSYIDIDNKEITSLNDTCSFLNEGTLILQGNFNSKNGIILNKISEDTTKYNFKLEVEDESFVLTLAGETGTLEYKVPMSNWARVSTENYVHVFTFDGSVIKYFLNTKEIEGVLTNDNFTPATEDVNTRLSNVDSDTSEFNSFNTINSIRFYSNCLTEQQAKRLVKTFDYSL